MFHNRKKELETLQELYESDKAEFVVIYGRRRIGKTALLEKFLEDKRGVRLLAREESEKKQLERVSQKLGEFFQDKFLLSNPYSNWDAFFTYLEEQSGERWVLAIDEFPYLVHSNAALPSILQAHWDETLKHSKIFLILCGSSISMMEDEILGHKSPLYGRRTSQILLKPMKYYEIRGFLPEKRAKELIRFYAVFGGVPAYLEVINPEKSVFKNIKSNVLSPRSYLNKDVMFLLREELQQPRIYLAILQSIAHGNTTLADIHNDTGIQTSTLGKYLSVLNDLHITKRETPVTASRKSRRGIYKIRDNFFRFWFRFLYPNKEYLEIGNITPLLDQVIRPHFHKFVSHSFENICLQYLNKLNKEGKLPFSFAKIGRWWYKDSEIDIVALNQKKNTVLFGECKWSKEKIGFQALNKLKRKSSQVQWGQEKRTEYYALFSKTGFTSNLSTYAQNNESLLLFPLNKFYDGF